jgi:hypothetical protein
LRRQAKRLGVKPKAVIADAGYGGEENYAYLENNIKTIGDTINPHGLGGIQGLTCIEFLEIFAY